MLQHLFCFSNFLITTFALQLSFCFPESHFHGYFLTSYTKVVIKYEFNSLTNKLSQKIRNHVQRFSSWKNQYLWHQTIYEYPKKALRLFRLIVQPQIYAALLKKYWSYEKKYVFKWCMFQIDSVWNNFQRKHFHLRWLPKACRGPVFARHLVASLKH